jgi:hypothetical protein
MSSAVEPLVVGMILVGQEARNKIPYQQLINILVSFIGPLPNFLTAKSVITSHANSQYLLFAPYVGFKLFFSLFGVFGGWYILKKKMVKFYPLLFFVFFVILFIMATFFGFDVRFPYVMVPFYFIILVYGFNQFRRRHKVFIYGIYYGMIFGLVFFYNLR